MCQEVIFALAARLDLGTEPLPTLRRKARPSVANAVFVDISGERRNGAPSALEMTPD